MRHCAGCSHPTICRTHGCAAKEHRTNAAKLSAPTEPSAAMMYWHERAMKAEAERDALLARSAEVNAKVLAAAAEVLRISDRKHEAWDQLRAALATKEQT